MKLIEKLNIANIDSERLQRGLKHLGLTLSKFDNIEEDRVPDLIALFKIAVDIDPKITTKFTKMDLRSKLEKVLKGLPINNHTNTIITHETSGKNLDTNDLTKSIHQKSNPNKEPQLASINKKLGKVKFFDSTKKFGYVNSFDDNKDCFVHISKLITPDINEDDIVIFETTDSRRKPGELDAIKVINKIPVFIFNKMSASKSLAYPLLDNHLEKEIILTEKYETGFATVTAHYRASSWRVSIIPSEIIQKPDSISFGKQILIKLLSNFNEYKSTIEWLTSLLQIELKEADLNSIYSEVINNFEQKTIAEINKELKNIKDVSFFQAFFEEKKKSFNKISFVLWVQGEVEKLPNPSKQAEVDIWYYEVLPTLDWRDLQQILTTLLAEQGATKHVEDTYTYLISQGWEINNKEELAIVAVFLESFKTVFPSIALDEANYTCKTNEFYIELYNKGLIKGLSDTRIKQYIEELKSDDEKAGFIEKLPTNKIISYYFAFPSLLSHQEKYIDGMIENEFSKINFLCFDLESDGEKINEFAWKTKLGLKSEADFKKQEDGISELVSLINSGILIVGQNIKEFDLPVLANYEASPLSNTVWDTLEVEMLLNPERFSYGLKTEHSAKLDTELTYRLFKNQISRIVILQNNYADLIELLPLKAIEAINLISCNSIWASLDYEYFVKQSNEFYRPNPTNQNISEQTFNELTEKLKEEGNKVIVAPEFLWNSLSYQFDLTFYSDSKSLDFYLNKEKIGITLSDEKLLKAILFRFVDICTLKGVKPYFQHLPVAIQLKLTTEQSTLICDNIDVDFANINYKPICIKPTDIEILKQHGNQVSELKVIVVGNELYNLTSKLQLGQDLDFATIFDRLKNEPIWLQMSGGKSFISLDKSHCRQLGITEFPEFVQNIWLEKIGKGKFKVWCNLNFEACINDLPLNEAYYIDWVDETFSKTNVYIIRPDARKSGYIAEQKRVNPESLYRKIYWVYQFKLFENIGHPKNPKVLIVNDELEIDKLSAYARRKGYYIPDTNASLARQVELLHTHRAPNKLLIASFQTLDKIISSNYTGPLDFIWDSFLLQEKLQMLTGKIDKKDIEITENDKYIPSLKGDSTKKEDFDTYKLFRLHKPLVDYYYRMLIDNNQASCLYMCDTRLSDFVDIELSLEVKAKFVSLWTREDEYISDYKEASDFFPIDKIDTNFDITEAKQIMRRLFLPQKANGDFHNWFPYQDDCLNDILPAEKDLLISLPTGAGKSVLFQAPALFRATFTNKLSIVISPLKALMHDQVEILQDMGLYSNVEYLSGDKSQEEIKDIYRRIVGGEITLLYITPERFRSRSFENCLFTRMDADNGLEYVVFDEAHCISQWGQEFRPDYLNAGRVIADKSKAFQMRKLLFSATISEQVANEIEFIMPGVVPISGTQKSYNPVRDHIKMDFKHNVDDDNRLGEIAEYLKKINPILSRAIIFVKSRKKVEECTMLFPDTLREVFGVDCSFADKVGSFHAGMDAEDRKDTYEKYKTGEIIILFATKAFGMGMDIPNIHFVTHYSPPSTFEDFLQEVGRAGRNEKQRLEAGFNNIDNVIKTICLTSNNDFAKLKDQLHKSRISWSEVKDNKLLLEKYIARFKPLIPSTEIPVAVPFNLYSNEIGSINDENDTKFRIALHWLEKLGRIKLGYFTITHLEFDALSLNGLHDRIAKCPSKDCEKVCLAIIELIAHNSSTSEVVQLSIASIRSITKLSIENLFIALQKNHSAGILKLLQDVIIEPTKIRLDEINYCKKSATKNEKYPALRAVFSFAIKVLSSVPSNESKNFEGEELDEFLNQAIHESINFKKLPWTKKDNVEATTKEFNNYIKDIKNKRAKHAFSIIRKLGKTKHESQPEKNVDSTKKIRIIQSVFNGYHKKEEWLNKITRLEKDCIKLLDYVSRQYFDNNIKKFNFPDIISELKIEEGIQYLSNLIFILSILGYGKTAGGLLQRGIETYLNTTENINDTIIDSKDNIIFNEFTETQEVRELKLISLQVLSEFKGDNLRDEQDSFIKGFFAANSKLELINLLENQIDKNHPIFKKFRGEAIKYEESRLNNEQLGVYNAEIKQHINVMAGPGSGKTHTLTLRVARLVHEIGINPEEILVLAYNRAVVSELKARLGRLFNDLGYGNLAKRIKIFTFHGLAKKYCENEIKEQSFDKWESTLLEQLSNAPGQIMNQLAPLKHILVDEFQDINETRMDLLNKLNELTNAYLFIIGDPNQSIYGYSRQVMDPYYYYEDFNSRFSPAAFKLISNYRSYPEILNLASQILMLPTEHQHLIPIPKEFPDENFITNYAQIIDRTQQKNDWWNEIENLCQEKVKRRNDTEAKPYKQIAILFRTNNEVYRGFQKIIGLKLPNTRIRIQGSLPYEFTRIRECHTIILHLKSKIGQISSNFKQTFHFYINNLIKQYQNWNHSYIRVIHALVLEYFDEQDENQTFENLLAFISELTAKDDGQLYKIYEKYYDIVGDSSEEIEIVLTTMHKVKGLEYDSVIVTPSYSNLAFNQFRALTDEQVIDIINEEKRLAFVAYTRARYRLFVVNFERELALKSSIPYELPANYQTALGIAVEPEIKKLNIGWAAKAYNFSGGVNKFISDNIKSGDLIFIEKRVVGNGNNSFTIHELFKEGSRRAIGQLSSEAGKLLDHTMVKGLIVNEVVVWSYEETLKFDQENPGRNYAANWCQEARNQGYIYLVDFAGFGVPTVI